MKINWHEDFIFHLASVTRPKVYVELGIQYCANFNRMIDYADQLIGVDMNPDARRYMSQSPKARFFQGTTMAFAQELDANPLQIDMLFIDADHSKEAVLQDFHRFFPFIAPHGLILLHDTHSESEYFMNPALCGTAWQSIEELAKDTGSFELMTIPVSPGLTICRKRRRQLAWHEQ